MDLFLPGPAGRLEARLDEPDADAALPSTGAARAAAIVCHPHPQHGGTLDNTVVFRTSRALLRAGLAVLRFNFRGVGESEGEHSGGPGEEGDAAAALDWLERERPGLELWAAGFSFGARTVASLARSDARIRRVICVALPVRVFDCPGVESIPQPTYFVCGSEDEFGTLADLRERLPDPPPHYDFDEVAGADHLFRRRSKELEELVHAWARASLDGREATT